MIYIVQENLFWPELLEQCLSCGHSLTEWDECLAGSKYECFCCSHQMFQLKFRDKGPILYKRDQKKKEVFIKSMPFKDETDICRNVSYIDLCLQLAPTLTAPSNHSPPHPPPPAFAGKRNTSSLFKSDTRT